jgi:hypothetical protein
MACTVLFISVGYIYTPDLSVEVNCRGVRRGGFVGQTQLFGGDRQPIVCVRGGDCAQTRGRKQKHPPGEAP